MKREVAMRSSRLTMLPLLLAFGLLSCAAQVGKPATEFRGVDLTDQSVRLSDFKGNRSLVLVFYVNHG